MMRWFHEFLEGPPIGRIVPAWFVLGSFGVGALSVPSSGPPVLLIPGFIISALIIGVATAVCSARLCAAGIGVMAITSWARSLAVWGEELQGTGSDFLASFIWFWIAVGCVIVMCAIGKRGLS